MLLCYVDNGKNRLKLYSKMNGCGSFELHPSRIWALPKENAPVDIIVVHLITLSEKENVLLLDSNQSFKLVNDLCEVH